MIVALATPSSTTVLRCMGTRPQGVIRFFAGYREGHAVKRLRGRRDPIIVSRIGSHFGIVLDTPTGVACFHSAANFF